MPQQPNPISSAVNAETDLPREERWLDIGRIVAAQGMRGEVRVYPESDFPERFLDPGPRWYLPPNVPLAAAEPQPITLEAGRELPNKNLYVLQFQGIRDRDAAEALRGAHLYVPASDRPTLEEGEYHLLDLLNLPVYHHRQGGPAIGHVIGLQTYAQDLLEIRLISPDGSDDTASDDKASDGETILIPFVDPLVPIVDLENQRIEIDPPPGLLPQTEIPRVE
ncbi:MAG: ribosome maturation factor RimM [Cyanophyceae cyanobacterium]